VARGDRPFIRLIVFDAHDRGHRDEGSFDDPGGTAELTLEGWIAGDVDEVHLRSCHSVCSSDIDMES
jgi:hypothetical protein